MKCTIFPPILSGVYAEVNITHRGLRYDLTLTPPFLEKVELDDTQNGESLSAHTETESQYPKKGRGNRAQKKTRSRMLRSSLKS